MSVPSITWRVERFNDLTALQVHDILRLRVDVFVVEQRCVYPEVDGHDPEATHVLGFSDRGTLAAYARVLPPHRDEPPHIGRVIVHPDFRGKHLGRHLMHHALHAVERLYGSRRSALAAQEYLVDFYATFGYVARSGMYLWDGIPHVDMVMGPV